MVSKEKNLRKNFISVLIILVSLLLISVVLTYVLPKGEFGILDDGNPDYSTVTILKDAGGIPLWKGILAPVLVFFSSDGISLFFLSLFILAVSTVFYLMEKLGGINAIVGVTVKKFANRQKLLLISVSFLFYCFGAFLGLFEEMIALLPIICALCISIGYDSFTGFLCCILSCGFGFASAITNPFTVLLASRIIGVNPTEHIYFRLVIFAAMFAVLQCFIHSYTKKISKTPSLSLTYDFDRKNKDISFTENNEQDKERERKLVKGYAVFFAGSLILIIVSSVIPVLRGLTVAILTFYTIVFGIITALYVCKDIKYILKEMLKGLAAGIPAVLFIALAGSIKFIFVEGKILPFIVSRINSFAAGNKLFVNAFVIFLIVLVLEFFISSSTAKAFIVMGILGMVSTGLSGRMSVLLYTLGDGYTNMFFPTSPVLLIALSMIEVDYFKWIKKSFWFFILTFVLLFGFIILGIVLKY